MHQLTSRIFLRDPTGDRDGLPTMALHGELRDVVVWVFFRLVSEVPRSLIRRCAWSDCARVFIGERNQRYCLSHQQEALQAARSRAVQAFRDRQRAKKKRGER